MEPQEPTKNDGSSGFSKRRISSILKGPRKSAKFPEPEQQENTVESAKPVEKRSSRRVSFAPANDVLLFSKDVKNTSPARSPLQELITATAATTTNRVKVAAAEDGVQSILGMETLLNAPLHAALQKDRVSFDVGVDFGEKTMMFPTDDAFMDMTHSHTINIASDEDISLRDFDILPNNGERPINMMIKTQMADLEKENQFPPSALVILDKSCTSRMIGELSCPEDNLSMDITEAQTRHILGPTDDDDDDDDDDDPFMGFFPTQEMYSQSDKRVTQTTEMKSCSKTPTSCDPKAVATTETWIQKMITGEGSQPITDMTSLKNPFLHASHPKNKVNFDEKDQYREKMILFTADDEFMDMTQNHTISIDSGPLPTQHMALDALDPGFKQFLASLTKPSGPSVEPVISRTMPTAGSSSVLLQDMHPQYESLRRAEMTSGQNNKALSTCIGMETSSKPPSKTEKVQGVQVKFDGEDDCQEKTIRFTANDAAMDVTQSHTVNIATAFEPQSLENVDVLPTCGEKTMRFTANDAAMDVTRSHTVNIATNLELVSNQNFDSLPTCGEKTVRFSASGAGMDVTQSHTVNIVTAFNHQSRQDVDVLPTCGEKTMRFTANDAAMDVTRSHTVNIATNELVSNQTFNITAGFDPQPPKNVEVLPACGEKTVTFTATDAAMDVTRSHTVNIATAFEPQSSQNADVFPSCGEKTLRFAAGGAGMDVTQSHTVNIVTAFNPQTRQDVDVLPTCGEKTMRFTANDAAMDVTRSHTVNIATNELVSNQTFNITAGFDPQPPKNVEVLPACGDKTKRYAANDAGMDVTQSHTVNILTAFDPQTLQNVDVLPTSGEKTMRFTANDAAMDVTRSHTVNIATNLELVSNQNFDSLPTCGEKTVRFAAGDATMDVTQSHTVNIATAFEPQSSQNADVFPSCGEKTMRFTANDAAMDVTRSHTVNIATNELVSNQTFNITTFDPQPPKNVEVLPACGEKTVTFTATDAAMDVTRSHTVNIASNLISDSVLPHQKSSISTHRNMDLPLNVKKTEGGLRKNRILSAPSLNPGYKNSLSKTSDPTDKPVITKTMAPVTPSPQEDVYRSGYLKPLKTQKPEVNTENKAPGFVPCAVEKPKHKAMTDCLEDNLCTDMSETQTSCILGQTCTDELSPCLSSELHLNPNFDNLNKSKTSLQNSSKASVSSNPTGVRIINHPHSCNTDETETRKELELRNETTLISPKVECSLSAVDKDTLHSQKSRQMSLANLQSKIRRLSNMLNTAPDTIVTDSCTVPLPELDQDLDKNSTDKTRSLPVVEPELEMGLVNAEDKTQDHCCKEAEAASTTATPFNVKTKQLISRLSVGGFKPKLPQRNKFDDPKRVDSVGEYTRAVTVQITSQLSNFDNVVSDIYDEELGSCEDMSETLDTRSPEKGTDKVSHSQEFNMDEPSELVFEEDFISTVHGQKRHFPEDENNENEKRVKTSIEMTTDTLVMDLKSEVLDCDGNITAAPTMTTRTTDLSNSSHTASMRCEATFESTFKHSMFESQLEDYGNEVQKKLDDGTITVSEFFKLFSIDFVIHNPRQSVLPGRLLSDTDCTLMDLLKDRHINRPKQMVYETDVQNLTETVDGLKVRMRDLDKPLRLVNRPLWEEMRNSSEKELKSFGAKLKERNNFFRKTSKTQSHEMKEVLYSNLVQANLKEQQKLRGAVEKADEMIKSLDDCIHQLETELAEVEEKGFDGKPSLKLCQEELKKVTEALACNERQMCELEMHKKQNSQNLHRLKAETRDLENNIAMLHTVNEWKLGKKEDNCTIYTFLYDTMNLHVVFEKSNGNGADKGFEQKISDITFNFLLNDKKAQFNARLVHKLLSQYIEEESAWVEKYPTSRQVPKLLHDMGLVVSRCRLLGEELRLLKMWGGLRLDILDISCVDTQVRILFSSLRKFAKFEVVFSISLINQLYVLQLLSFKNKIGNTTVQQIEETVVSFSPGKKLLTKIVKKIHEDLLC